MKNVTEYAKEFQAMTAEQLREVLYTARDIYKVKQLRSLSHAWTDVVASRSFSVGQQVKLKDSACKGKGAQLFGKVGTVEKIGRSKVHVSFGTGPGWCIPPLMLEVVK